MANWRLSMPVNGSNSNAPQSRAALEQAEFDDFLKSVVMLAFEEISAELQSKGRATEIRLAPAGISLNVAKNGVEEIYYNVYRYALPNRIFPYVEVKAKSRGSRVSKVNRTGSPLVNFKENNITIKEITKEHVISSFYGYYNDILTAIAEVEAIEAAKREEYNYDKKTE